MVASNTNVRGSDDATVRPDVGGSGWSRRTTVAPLVISDRAREGMTRKSTVKRCEERMVGKNR
jgi:hypothetical protein